ncbi:hypothetical protein ACQEVC_34440 [Plantactinospora sp. CA-294935]|uniref:hypothetical protein n=1 Tax=Plantactinospora sp. CA-294935 TaxID=3240012 RepID=UPI003D89D414
MYNLHLLKAIRARGVVTLTWAWPIPRTPVTLREAKRRAQAELYWQARMSNAVPLGPVTYWVASRAVFEDYAGPALVAEVQAAQLPT